MKPPRIFRHVLGDGQYPALAGLRLWVLRFAVDAAFLANYQVRQVGAAVHREYWIPADELDSFNDHIVGAIELIASFPRGDSPT